MSHIINYQSAIHDLYIFDKQPILNIECYFGSQWAFPVAYNNQLWITDEKWGFPQIDFTGLRPRHRGFPWYESQEALAAFPDNSYNCDNDGNCVEQFDNDCTEEPDPGPPYINGVYYNQQTGVTLFGGAMFTYGPNGCAYYDFALSRLIRPRPSFDTIEDLENTYAEGVGNNYNFWNTGEFSMALITPCHLLCGGHFTLGNNQDPILIKFIGKSGKTYEKIAEMNLWLQLTEFEDDPRYQRHHPAYKALEVEMDEDFGCIVFADAGDFNPFNLPGVPDVGNCPWSDSFLYKLTEPFTPEELNDIKVYKLYNHYKPPNSINASNDLLRRDTFYVVNPQGIVTVGRSGTNGSSYPFLSGGLLSWLAPDGNLLSDVPLQGETIISGPDQGTEILNNYVWSGDSNTIFLRYSYSRNETCIGGMFSEPKLFNIDFDDPNSDRTKGALALKEYLRRDSISDSWPNGFNIEWISDWIPQGSTETKTCYAQCNSNNQCNSNTFVADQPCPSNFPNEECNCAEPPPPPTFKTCYGGCFEGNCTQTEDVEENLPCPAGFNIPCDCPPPPPTFKTCYGGCFEGNCTQTEDVEESEPCPAGLSEDCICPPPNKICYSEQCYRGDCAESQTVYDTQNCPDGFNESCSCEPEPPPEETEQDDVQFPDRTTASTFKYPLSQSPYLSRQDSNRFFENSNLIAFNSGKMLQASELNELQEKFYKKESSFIFYCKTWLSKENLLRENTDILGFSKTNLDVSFGLNYPVNKIIPTNKSSINITKNGIRYALSISPDTYMCNSSFISLKVTNQDPIQYSVISRSEEINFLSLYSNVEISNFSIPDNLPNTRIYAFVANIDLNNILDCINYEELKDNSGGSLENAPCGADRNSLLFQILTNRIWEQQDVESTEIIPSFIPVNNKSTFSEVPHLLAYAKRVDNLIKFYYANGIEITSFPV